MAGSGFLDLPPRSSKPRRAGLTHVLDKGIPLAGLEPALALFGRYVDVWKLGWGTAYLDPGVGEKVALLARHDILACVGGTLLEVAWAQGKAAACLDWAVELGFPCVEVSNGAVGMPVADKRRLIASSARRFTVLAEVGAKDPGAPVSAAAWAATPCPGAGWGSLAQSATVAATTAARRGPRTLRTPATRCPAAARPRTSRSRGSPRGGGGVRSAGSRQPAWM